MMFWYDGVMGGWGYGLMSISMVLFWALVIVAILALVRSTTRAPQQAESPPWHPSTPDQALAERFARGEIDEAEYLQRLEVLRAQASSARSEPGSSAG
ncbi:SHOCT domain-containing protein [Lipingzhangella sp. LS1_29]|uniref:SHOCT domain-containing protein n=1 Tax=Lipingzhangella rawalii TaxID=2055835 RepID=A0ABU2HAL9_9ACTN|nr:SHOCT domain-containing protein [Lipingzhangella rawalii]MDS1272323.1 SHOCT domain-containing protein [Lipingzhangella rawalii]